jgi:hypothetical protein
MLTARTVQGFIVYAPEAEKDAAPFACPGCGAPVILKKGEINIHHFAHRPDSTCDLRGESVEHMTAKWQIYQALKFHPQIVRVEVEYTLWPNTRADVMFRKGRKVVAVEIQRSRLDTETIDRRMAHYTAQGIAVLWLIFPFKVKAERFDANTWVHSVTPQKWQRYIQKLYFGRLYEWAHGWGLDVYQTHLTGSWNRRQSGIRTGEIVNIVDDFDCQTRTDPKAILYLDTLPKWWATRAEDEDKRQATRLF